MGSLILFLSFGWVEMYESGGMRVKKITRYVRRGCSLAYLVICFTMNEGWRMRF
jgi:hypothetical protein